MKISPSLRRFIERCSRNVVLEKRLPSRLGARPLFISPGASLRYWRGLDQPAFEDVYDFAGFHVKPGHRVWDVGSNMGLFAFAAAGRAGSNGHVLCIEPDPWSVRLLKRSGRLPFKNDAEVDVLPAALGERASIEWLHVPERGRAGSHLASAGGGSGPVITGGVRERHLTPVLTLDLLASAMSPPDVLKIDVDGSELAVLRGGQTLLKTKPPVILIEVFERNADAVTSLLHGLGYGLFTYENGESGKQPVTRTSYNTLALPS